MGPIVLLLPKHTLTLSALQDARSIVAPSGSERNNAVLVCHALTGDSHAAGRSGPGHPTDGWWDPLIGPGRALDTDRLFVVCVNVLGGCQGSTGPSSVDPATGRARGLIDLGRLGTADPYGDIALLVATARETWSDEAMAARAEEQFAEVYGSQLDRDRLDFYLRLDPLTW